MEFGYFFFFPLNDGAIWGAYDKFPDFYFRLGTFIESTHMKL